MQLLSLYTALVSFLTFILVRSLLVKWRKHQTAQRLGCRPVNRYPHSLPFGLDLYRARLHAIKEGRYNRFNLALFDKYGSTYAENTMSGRTTMTSETANFQALDSTKFEDFGRDPARQKAMEPSFGRGILSSNGHEWRQARDLVNPLFKRTELSDVESFKTFVDRMFALIPRDGSTVDLQPLLQKLFLDSSTEFIFGESINSLRDTSGESQGFLDAMTQSVAGAGMRGNYAGGSLSFLYMFDKTWKENYSKVHSFVDQRIAHYFARKDAAGKKSSSEKRKRYVLLDGMAEEIRDPTQLHFHLLQISSPARDAPAIAVSNTLFYLARNPQVWRTLREQALAVGDQPLTFELLKSLHSFRYALFEGIRLQGPSGQIQRVSFRDTVLPRGGGPNGSFPIFVPKGTSVYLNNFPKSRDPSIWGEDLEAFRPVRFEGKLLNWKFIPFFGGPRICPANQQVIVQGVYLLVRMTREFEFIENRDECFEYVERIKMLCESRNRIQVALHPAKA